MPYIAIALIAIVLIAGMVVIYNGYPSFSDDDSDSWSSSGDPSDSGEATFKVDATLKLKGTFKKKPQITDADTQVDYTPDDTFDISEGGIFQEDLNGKLTFKLLINSQLIKEKEFGYKVYEDWSGFHLDPNKHSAKFGPVDISVGDNWEVKLIATLDGKGTVDSKTMSGEIR